MKLPVFFRAKKNINALRPKQTVKQPGDTFRFQHFLRVHELFREFLQIDMSETSKTSENDDSDLQRKPSTPQPDKTSAPIWMCLGPRANTLGCKHTSWSWSVHDAPLKKKGALPKDGRDSTVTHRVQYGGFWTFPIRKSGQSGRVLKDNWLVVSTHLKNISQNGNLPQVGVKIKNVWNHHLFLDS